MKDLTSKYYKNSVTHRWSFAVCN